jgi:hypothetical protein
MSDLLVFLRLPALQIMLLMLPMLWIHDGRYLHRVMSRRFWPIAQWSAIAIFPVSIMVASKHHLGAVMGAALYIPHVQWAALLILYQRFVRKHSRAPCTFAERRDERNSSIDLSFRLSAMFMVFALPLALFGVLHWILTGVSNSQ